MPGISPLSILTLTQNKMKQHFQTQLETVEPCSGDFLNGRKYDQVVKDLRGSKIPALNSEGIDFHFYVDKLIASYKEHAGEKQLFYIVEHQKKNQRKTIRLEIIKIWETELDDVFKKGEFEFVGMSTCSSIPKFRSVI